MTRDFLEFGSGLGPPARFPASVVHAFLLRDVRTLFPNRFTLKNSAVVSVAAATATTTD